MDAHQSKMSGPESRYLSRFSNIRPQSGESIKNIDSANNVADHLTTAKASLRAQQANTQALFGTAKEAIAGIDTLQQLLGHTFVRNMPLPSKEIAASPSKQLGYVQLTMRFLQAGVVHFMEEMDNANNRIEMLEKLIGNLAEYDQEVDIAGELQALDLDSLESPLLTQEPASAMNSATSTHPLTPPVSPSGLKHVPKLPETKKSVQVKKK